MASVIREPNGRKRIEFMNTDGSRPRIRLGEASKSQAEAVKVKVEALISAKITLGPSMMKYPDGWRHCQT